MSIFQKLTKGLNCLNIAKGHTTAFKEVIITNFKHRKYTASSKDDIPALEGPGAGPTDK